MSQDLERRVEKLEESNRSLSNSLNDLNTTIALLNQTVETMSRTEQKRQQILDRSILFIIGGFIAAGVSWVVRGGLSS